MASPGELVRTIASALGLPEATITVHDRNLVVAGLRHKGGRGWSAAKVSTRDAAHLLTAVLASAQVKDSVHSVQRYRETRLEGVAARPFSRTGITELVRLTETHTFIDALEALITSFAVGSLRKRMLREAVPAQGELSLSPPHIEVAALSPGTLGEIRISGLNRGVTVSTRYRLPDPWRQSAGATPAPEELDAWEARIRRFRFESDLEQFRRVSEKTILHIAELLTPAPSEE